MSVTYPAISSLDDDEPVDVLVDNKDRDDESDNTSNGKDRDHSHVYSMKKVQPRVSILSIIGAVLTFLVLTFQVISGWIMASMILTVFISMTTLVLLLFRVGLIYRYHVTNKNIIRLKDSVDYIVVLRLISCMGCLYILCSGFFMYQVATRRLSITLNADVPPSLLLLQEKELMAWPYVVTTFILILLSGIVDYIHELLLLGFITIFENELHKLNEDQEDNKRTKKNKNKDKAIGCWKILGGCCGKKSKSKRLYYSDESK
jgi:hypothetical protein